MRFFILPKTNKINIFFCIFLVICIIFVSVAPIYILPKTYKNYNFDTLKKSNGVFCELWEVDTFEGGTNSRSKFLENVAMAFEKQNKGVYVIVRTLTIDQVKLMLSQDKMPDVISFGIGAGQTLQYTCQEMNVDTKNIRRTLVESGTYKNVQLAYPWCMGGYVLCSQSVDVSQDFGKDKTLGVGVENNVPPNNGFANVTKFDTQYDAYKAYLNKEFDILLGTQRDYFRVSNKISLGMLEKNYYHYIDSYTDLIQYVACVTLDKSIQSYVFKFIDYLLSEKIQSKLTSIGMFGVTDKSIYQGTDYDQFEKAVLRINKFQNVFQDDITLQQKRDDLYSKS